MIAVGAGIAVWTTVMIYMDNRVAKTNLEGIDAVDNSSAAGSENIHGKRAGSLITVDNKV
jgi:hypothetical protein